MERLVIAIGGNSLIKDQDHLSIKDQWVCARETSASIASIIKEKNYQLAVTHGNGPQVGFILLRAEVAVEVLPTVPIEICGADTQGAIGYMLQQSLTNDFNRIGINRKLVTVVTQTIVDEDDDAFLNPTKPIGPFYDRGQVKTLRGERGWTLVEDAGRGWRRVVPSPIPQKIVEIEAIKDLLSRYVVICMGGGGLPVIEKNGKLEGLEAVIDKDLGASLLAREIKAATLLISTAIDGVYLDYGSPSQRIIHEMTTEEAISHLADGQFPPGSMGPKIRACIQFLERGGKRAIITSPELIHEGLEGKAGTTIRG